MSAFRLLSTVLIGLALGAVSSVPAGARGIEGVKRGLGEIESQLLAGQWSQARAASDGALRDLIESYAWGKETRPVYGAVMAYRALAEAGLGDVTSAVWDWTAAAQFSHTAAAIDPRRFGTAGRQLQDALSQVVELSKPQSEVKMRTRGRSPQLPEAARRLGHFKCSIVARVVIDGDGRPARVLDLESTCFDNSTPVVALELEGYRGYRFEPLLVGEQAVSFEWDVTTKIAY